VGKLAAGNGLGRKGRYYDGNVRVRFTLEETEKKLLYGLAKSRFRATGTGKPAVGEAVVYLLRVAFNCFQYHTDAYQNPEPISIEEAHEAGLTVPQKSKKLALPYRRHVKRDDDGRFEDDVD
jgi:hypothetical protein